MVLKQMNAKVDEELKHIPEWPNPQPQGELRAIYQNTRMNGLSEKAEIKHTANEVLQQCIDFLRANHPGYEFLYDAEFFRQRG
jgi:hypothetical protein